MSVIRDALRILARFFGLRPGPDVERLKEPPRKRSALSNLDIGYADDSPVNPPKEKKP